jgi:hypothetical protein
MEPYGKLGSGPNVGVVGGMRLHSDEVGIEVFGMYCAIASHHDFCILGNTSQSYQRSTIAEVAFYHVTAESQINVATTFFNVEIERLCPNGINDSLDGVNSRLSDASDRVGANEVSD